MELILYSKPGCHLCEGLEEKLRQIQSFDLHLEIRDITTQDDWFSAYEFSIPVLFYKNLAGEEISLPRPSPRISLGQLEQFLQRYVMDS